MKKNIKGGFTLLELLIVIAIIAILSVALVIVLNPAETLKKARDSQRISDLSTLKTAIGLYLTSVSPAYLGGAASNALCKTPDPDTARGSAAAFPIWYSIASDTTDITDLTLDGSTATTPAYQVLAASLALTDGNGWIPINFDAIPGGSPISNLPIDPTNTVASGAGVASTDLVYRYSCSQSPLAYEIDAQLESTAYTVTDNKRVSDGGNNSNYYETGTNLSIFSTGTDF